MATCSHIFFPLCLNLLRREVDYGGDLFLALHILFAAVNSSRPPGFSECDSESRMFTFPPQDLALKNLMFFVYIYIRICSITDFFFLCFSIMRCPMALTLKCTNRWVCLCLYGAYGWFYSRPNTILNKCNTTHIK